MYNPQNPSNAKPVPFFVRFLETQFDPSLYPELSSEELEQLAAGMATVTTNRMGEEGGGLSTTTSGN